MPRDLSSIRIARLNDLVQELSSHGILPKKELMARLEYTQGRTLERDLAFLRDQYGVEIDYDRHKGGYRLRGTGRFLEVMAIALGFTLEEFSKAALSAGKAVKINSTCTVFAESEVVSLTAQGVARDEVALGIHKAIVSRSVGLLKKVAAPGKIFFAGGVALNECVRILLEKEMNSPVFVPPDPQLVGAIGAALSAL